MKRLISLALCAVLLVMLLPAGALADGGYSTVSNKNVALEYPSAESYYATPWRAAVKASRTNGSIYFMPTPRDGNGVLGTVANGTEVTLLAEQSGFCFFTTSDGRMGWNGAKFFDVLGPAFISEPVADRNTFRFDSGASIVLPSGFLSLGAERDRNNAYVTSYYTNFDQSMDLTLTEISTNLYYQRDTDFFNSLYASLKEDYPDPTYDSKTADSFDLSGYSGNDIYYFRGILSDQVVYLIKMIYPTRNRGVCDGYVEQITFSFKAAPGAAAVRPSASAPSSSVKLPDDPTSPYAVALRDNLLRGVSYTADQKRDIISETYYSRKDSGGNRQPWYTSASYYDPNTGYQIGLYYADGLIFFADAYIVGHPSSVTFYFWGDQLLCVHDLRGDDTQLRFAGSDTYNAIVREFGDLYAKALQYAR